MTKEFDTSWFNLRNYDKLTDLDLSGWYDQIIYRRIIKNIMEEIHMKKKFPETQKVLAKDLRTMCECIKQAPVQPESKEYLKARKNDNDAYPFNTHSVRSTPIGLLLRDINAIYKWNLSNFAEKTKDYNEEEQVRSYQTPIDLFFYNNGGKGNCSSLLTVNLGCSDEQIITDFRRWLTEYRRYTGIHSSAKNFADKHLIDWRQWQLLPYIDLMLMAEVEGKKITQLHIAKLIFPDEGNVDIVERTRNTTKPKAEWLMQTSTINALEAQLESLML